MTMPIRVNLTSVFLITYFLLLFVCFVNFYLLFLFCGVKFFLNPIMFGLAQAFMVTTLILSLRLRIAEAGHLAVFNQNLSGGKAVPLHYMDTERK